MILLQSLGTELENIRRFCVVSRRLVTLIALCCAWNSPTFADSTLKFNEALDAYTSGQHARAATLFTPLANAKHAPSQMLLGVMHTHGDGVAQDLRLAFAWFQRAAVLGHLPAFYQLGKAHARGLGTQKNLALGEVWLKRAALKGHFDAEMLLRTLKAESRSSTQLKASTSAPRNKASQ